jgi:hypothetical protein
MRWKQTLGRWQTSFMGPVCPPTQQAEEVEGKEEGDKVLALLQEA